jgi:hypothetical protein
VKGKKEGWWINSLGGNTFTSRDQQKVSSHGGKDLVLGSSKNRI